MCTGQLGSVWLAGVETFFAGCTWRRYGLRLGSPAAAPCGSGDCIEKDPFKWVSRQRAVPAERPMYGNRSLPIGRTVAAATPPDLAAGHLVHAAAHSLPNACCPLPGAKLPQWDAFFKACKGCRVDFMGERCAWCWEHTMHSRAAAGAGLCLACLAVACK